MTRFDPDAVDKAATGFKPEGTRSRSFLRCVGCWTAPLTFTRATPRATLHMDADVYPSDIMSRSVASAIYFCMTLVLLSAITSTPGLAQYDALVNGILGNLVQAGRSSALQQPAYGGPGMIPTRRYPRAAQPSFNCARRFTPDELAICQTPELIQLDRQMADLYVADLRRGVDVAWLKATKTVWLADRSRCGSQISCIRSSYLARIQQLSGATDGAATLSAQNGDVRATTATVAGAPAAPMQDQASSAPVAATTGPEAGQRDQEPHTLSPHELELMLMRSRPDLYVTDLDALSYATRQLGASSPECQQMRSNVEDEVMLPSAIESARAIMARDLETARRIAPTVRTELVSAVTLDAYDPHTQVLGFAQSQGPSSLAQAQATFMWDFDHTESVCLASPSPRALRFMSDHLAHKHQLTVAVQGGDRITPPRLPPQVAKPLIQAMYNQPPYISAVVRLDVGEREVVGHIEAAKLTAFREVDPTSHKQQMVVLWQYPAALFSAATPSRGGSQAGSPTASAADGIPSTFNNLALNVVRLDPGAIPDGKLLNQLPSIISDEQSAYRQARVTNERPAGALFENDDIDGREPTFAANQLLPKFRDLLHRTGVATSTVLRSGIDLSGGGVTYDFATGKLLLSKLHPLLLDPPHRDAYASNADEVRLKVDALKMSDGQVIYEPVPVVLPGDRNQGVVRDIARVLQEVSPPYVALDRLLLTPDLPMTPAAAERIVGLLHGSNQHLTSVVTYSVQSTSGSGSHLLLLGHVEGVTLIGPDGAQLARFDASAFPLASTVTDTARAATDEEQQVEQAKRESEARIAAHAKEERAREDAAKAAALETAKQDHERQIVQEQERPATGFGPEIGHVELGMSMDAAEQAIRRTMKVGAVVESKPGAWGYAPTLVHPKVFISTDGSDMVSIAALPGSEQRVVAITRRLALPTPPVQESELVGLLTQKYGQPASTYGRTMTWAPRWEARPGPCKQMMSSTQHSGFVLSEGTLPPMRGRQDIPPADEYAKADFAGLMAFEFNDPSAAARDLRECPTTVWASYDLDPKDPYVETAVFDGGWLAKVLGDGIKADAPGRLEAVKALLDQ